MLRNLCFSRRSELIVGSIQGAQSFFVGLADFLELLYVASSVGEVNFGHLQSSSRNASISGVTEKSQDIPELGNLGFKLLFTSQGIIRHTLVGTVDGDLSTFINSEFLFIAMQLSRQLLNPLIEVFPARLRLNERLPRFGELLALGLMLVIGAIGEWGLN